MIIEDRYHSMRYVCWMWILLILFTATHVFGDDNIPVSAETREAVQVLFNHPKIKAPQAILSKFLEGKSTTPIIVGLHDPQARALGLPEGQRVKKNFKSPTVREQHRNEVKSVLNRVLSGFNASHINPTHRFSYLFGFSAEVTITGLQTLVEHMEVLSIEEDGELFPNTLQGKSLISANYVSNIYGGAGVSIAIVDSGVDYEHVNLGGDGIPNPPSQDFTNAKVIGGRDTGEDDDDPMDFDGHGTACAGIAAGALPSYADYNGGVAPEAKIYALKTKNSAGNLHFALPV